MACKARRGDCFPINTTNRKKHHQQKKNIYTFTQKHTLTYTKKRDSRNEMQATMCRDVRDNYDT